MDDSLEWELEDDSGPQRPEACALDLKKYFYFIGVVAVVILSGAYWYTEHYPVSVASNDIIAGSGLTGNSPAVANGRPSLPVGAANNQLGGVTNQVATEVGAGPAMPFMQNIGSGGFASVAMNLRNSVVNISTTNSSNPAATVEPGAETIRFANPFSKRSNGSIGSGIIIRNDGYIVSNYHIVRGAGGIVVTVFNNQGTQRYSADVIKMDEVMDLVLLKINPQIPLHAATLGDSNHLRVADEVIAIGSPFGLDQTVSRGIVSALRNSLNIEGITHANLVQTDAAINQGNSGGPLIASNGQVIGINTAIYTPTGAFSGIGFAIPSNQVRLFMQDEMGQPLTAVRGFTVAAPAQPAAGAGPVISANARAPGNHNDGRNNMNCASCHQFKGQAAGMAVAAPRQPSAPMISANARPPGNHNDGRNAMNCASCHQFKGQAAGMAVAAPRQPGAPMISANARTPGNHNDGRNTMNCASCHQIRGGATGGLAALQFTAPPTTLAMNVAVPAADFGVPGSNISLMGAGIMPLNAALAERLKQPRDKGVFVSQVVPGSPASIGGLKAGDIILKVEGKRIWAPGQLTDMTRRLGNGNTVRLGILRNGRKDNLDMTIALGPTAAAQAPASAVMQARAVPNEFNWRGINVENFITVALPVNPGDPTIAGAEIDGVTKGTPAAKTGLLPRDIILQINSQPVGKAELLDRAIRNAKGQTSNLLMVMRDGRQFFVMLP